MCVTKLMTLYLVWHQANLKGMRDDSVQFIVGMPLIEGNSICSPKTWSVSTFIYGYGQSYITKSFEPQRT
jgi:hypothetical protein